MLKTRRALLAMVVLVVLNAGMYAVTLDYEYIWDDQLFYESSPELAEVSNLTQVPSVDYWGLVNDPGSPDGSPYYRPLALAFIVLERSLLGTSPFGFRLLHTLIHLFNVLAVCLLSRRLINHDWGAIVAAAFFAFLPYGVDTVLFLTSICDLLAVSFFCLAAWMFLSYLERDSWYYLVGVALATLLAVSSKENTVALPVCLAAVYHNSPGTKEWHSRAKAAKGVAASAGAVLVFLTVRYQVVGGLSGMSIGSWLKWLPSDLLTVLRWTFAPISLVLEQPVDREFGGLFWWIGCVVLVAGVVAIIFGFRRAPKFVSGIVIFSLTALPSLMAIQWTGVFAPRYLYLPSLGLVLTLAGIFAAIPRFFKGLSILILVGCIYLSAGRAVEWQDRVTLFAIEIGRNPESYTALSNLGNIFAMAGDRDRAIAFQQRAALVAEKRSQNCRAAFAYSNMGSLLAQGEQNHQRLKALQFFRHCTELCPRGSQNAWFGIARIRAASEEWQEAARAIGKARDVGPERAEIFAQSALIAVVLGKEGEAERWRQQVQRLAGDGSTLLRDLERRLQAARRYQKANERHQQ